MCHWKILEIIDMNATVQDFSKAEVWLMITTLIYFLMNGAQIFETAAVVPKWTANPPDSFSLISGASGINLKSFWIVLHSIHEIAFLIAIYFCWRIEPVRNWLLILFAIHFAVRMWTLVYFAPHIMEFQKLHTDGARASTELIAKTTLWRTLNYIRVALFIGISIGLLPVWYKVLRLKWGL
jgi:hypothetical protein